MESHPGSGIVSVQVVKILSGKRGQRYEALMFQLNQATAAMTRFGSKQKTPEDEKVSIGVAKGLETAVVDELEALTPRKIWFGLFKGGDQDNYGALQSAYSAYQSQKRVYEAASASHENGSGNAKPPLSDLEKKTEEETNGQNGDHSSGKKTSPSGTYQRPRSGTRSIKAHSQYTQAELEALRNAVGGQIGLVNKERKKAHKDSAPYIVCSVRGNTVHGKDYEDLSAVKAALLEPAGTNGNDWILMRDPSGKYLKVDPSKLT